MNRSNTWAFSSFADRVRGSKKPCAATIEEWNEWEQKAKDSHPIRFWITETALDFLQDMIYWPVDILYELKYYIVNRWIDQSHALVAHSKHIKPGSYADFDYRILHCLFDELVDFVEIEKAYSNYRWKEEKCKQMKWWQGGAWRTRTWRSPEDGLEYLRWEAHPGDEDIPSSQSEAAKEILDMYDWWVNRRPLREDPMEASGWSDYCDSFRSSDLGLCGVLEDDKTDVKPMLDHMRKLEEQYHDEDTEMLIRLIKIRGHLWA